MVDNHIPPRKRPPTETWESRAQRNFHIICALIFGFMIGVLLLIFSGLYLRYRLEVLKIERANNGSPAFIAATRKSPAAPEPRNTEPLPEGGNHTEKWSSEKTVELVEGFVTGQSKARETDGKSAAVPLSEVLKFIDGLLGSNTLTSEAVQTISQVRKKLVDAGIDVGVDTIKKITGKLFEKKEKLADKDSGVAGSLSNLHVNISCAQRDIVEKIAHRPLSQPKSPQPKMICPTPLVPAHPG